MIVDAEGRPRCRSDPVQNNITRTRDRGLPKIGNVIICGEDGFGLGRIGARQEGMPHIPLEELRRFGLD